MDFPGFVLTPVAIMLFFMINNSNLILSKPTQSTIQSSGFPANRNNYKLNSSDVSSMKSSHRHRRSAVVRDKQRLWDFGIIPYEFNDVFTSERMNVIKKAMRVWEKVSCIRFVKRNADEHASYIVFKKKQCGCCADIGKGKVPGPRYISLPDECNSFGIIIHELGHAIGYYHEHIRPDRDDYIDVRTDNIAWGLGDLFRKRTSAEIDTLGLSYDPHSIMHYRSNEFARNQNDPVLILKKEPDSHVGREPKLSETDIISVNMLYNCSRDSSN